MNFIHVAGNLGADPEVRFTSNGKKVTTLRLASKSRKGQNEETIWWRVTLWGDQWDQMIPHFKKGSSAMVFGEMKKPEIFTDREGKPQVSMEVVASQLSFSPFGSGKRDEASSPSTTPYNPPAPQQMASSPKGTDTFDDEVPF